MTSWDRWTIVYVMRYDNVKEHAFGTIRMCTISGALHAFRKYIVNTILAEVWGSTGFS